MSHYITYEKWTFDSDKIDSGNLYLATSLPGSSLEVSSFVVIVRCDDPSILDFQRNAQLLYYARPGLPMVFRVQKIRRAGTDLYEISSTSTLGLLTESRHMGGIYTGQTVDEVITDICGAVPVIIKTVFKKIKLYGWLPIAESRSNLAQVLFAIGATLKTDLDGVLRVEGLWDGFSGQVSKDNIYTDVNADSDAKITQVIVTEHQYVPGTEEKLLFEGTVEVEDPIHFDEPMHTLEADGFTILASGANWAKLSVGTGTLKGKTYIHNTRQISRGVQSAQTPNIKTEGDVTLVSPANSQAVVQRLAAYYRCLERIDAPVVFQGEAPGDRLAVFHPFDKICVSACLESADITLSNTLKAQEKLLVGYVPPQFDDVEYFDTTKEITESGTLNLPDGVTEITAVIISGGQGGQKGGNGERGGAGTSAHTTGNNTGLITGVSQGKPGTGGAGGTKGAGGSGGKIYVVDINLNGISSIFINIGAGGSVNGGPGGATKVVVGGTTYSSDSGSTSPNGYTDIITGKTYATPGLSGTYDGGKGGDGVSGNTGSGGNGASVAGYSGGKGNTLAYNYGDVRYALPAGGGGAAYGSPGGAAPNTCSGGAGAAAVQNKSAPTTPGCGGHGGNGGGGGGGGGAGYIEGGTPTSSVTANGRAGGSGGTGSDGTTGAPGIVLLFYRTPKKISSGQFVDKNGRRILDRLFRRIIV